MATFIPKLEWNHISLVGNTSSGSPTVSAIASTTNVVVGMFIDHANFPAGTTVLSKTSNSITASANATASTTGATLALCERLEFQYPATVNDGEKISPNVNLSKSVAGVRQAQVNHLEAKLGLEFKFLTPAELTKLRDRWYLSWAVYYKEFRFYESKEIGAYVTYELDNDDFTPDRAIPKAGDFLYKIKLSFRRVL